MSKEFTKNTLKKEIQDLQNFLNSDNSKELSNVEKFKITYAIYALSKLDAGYGYVTMGVYIITKTEAQVLYRLFHSDKFNGTPMKHYINYLASTGQGPKEQIEERLNDLFKFIGKVEIMENDNSTYQEMNAKAKTTYTAGLKTAEEQDQKEAKNKSNDASYNAGATPKAAEEQARKEAAEAKAKQEQARKEAAEAKAKQEQARKDAAEAKAKQEQARREAEEAKAKQEQARKDAEAAAEAEASRPRSRYRKSRI